VVPILSVIAVAILFVEDRILAVLFLMAAVGFYAIRLWPAIRTLDWRVVDEWVRAQIGAIVIRDWYSPSQAAEMFCDPAVVREWHEARAQISSSIMEVVREQGRKGGGGTGSDPLIAIGTPTLRKFSDQPPELLSSQDAAQGKYTQSDHMLRHELVRQLISGVLIAKGSPVHDDDERPERVIPSSLWKDLKLDLRNSEASGGGRRYGGVSIGKKR